MPVQPLRPKPAESPATEQFYIDCPICNQHVLIRGMDGYETFAKHYKSGSRTVTCPQSDQHVGADLLQYKQPVQSKTRRP